MRGCLVATSQMITVLSLLPEANERPSGLNATLLTTSLPCFRSLLSSGRPAPSQKTIEPSHKPIASVSPLGLKVRLVTLGLLSSKGVCLRESRSYKKAPFWTPQASFLPSLLRARL